MQPHLLPMQTCHLSEDLVQSAIFSEQVLAWINHTLPAIESLHLVHLAVSTQEYLVDGDHFFTARPAGIHNHQFI